MDGWMDGWEKIHNFYCTKEHWMVTCYVQHKNTLTCYNYEATVVIGFSANITLKLIWNIFRTNIQNFISVIFPGDLLWASCNTYTYECSEVSGGKSETIDDKQYIIRLLPYKRNCRKTWETRVAYYSTACTFLNRVAQVAKLEKESFYCCWMCHCYC